MDSTAEEVRHSLNILSGAVREMNPTGAKAIPSTPIRFNLLARPLNRACRICGLPGHAAENIQRAAACQVALVSIIGFWEDMIGHLSFLYKESDRFRRAIAHNVSTYEMRFDNAPLIGGAIETVIVDHLARNYLKFQNHLARIRPKAVVFMHEDDKVRLDKITDILNGYLLNGYTLSELFKRSLANSQ